jgi:PBSX family phage terminase large subunit
MLDLPVKKQRYSILHSNKRLNIWQGAKRSSKTVCSIIRWIEYTITCPPGNLLMVGKTQKSLEKNVLDVIAELVGSKNFVYKRITGEVILYGRKIDVVGANDEKSKDKIQGRTLSGAYGDEVPLWPESFFNMMLSGLSVKGAKFFGTANPESPRHWLKVKFLDREAELNLKSFHFTLDDNPSIDPEYVADLKREYVGLWYSRYILGLWVAATGAIFDQFDINKNVWYDELPEKFDKIYVSVDYGSANPSCFLYFGRPKGKKFWIVFKEYYYDSRKEGRQKTDSEYAKDLVKFLDGKFPQKILVDPSASSFIQEVRSLRKYRVGLANNDVLDGIRLCAKVLANEEIFIYKDCPILIEKIQSYVWDEKAQAVGIDKPVKVDDHPCDAFRYGVNEIFDHNYNKMPVDLPR